MKVFVVSFFIGSALCAQLPYAPAPYHPAPAPYHPAPHHPAPYHEEKLAPQPFAYEYGGADAYGRHFAKTETQDDHGVVNGEYRVELPDGRVQIVTYHADHESGFVADVKYEGEAKPYVPEPKSYAPASHHAPLLHHAAPLVHGPVHHAAPLVHAPVHHAVHHAQPVFHGGPVRAVVG